MSPKQASAWDRWNIEASSIIRSNESLEGAELKARVSKIWLEIHPERKLAFTNGWTTWSKERQDEEVATMLQQHQATAKSPGRDVDKLQDGVPEPLKTRQPGSDDPMDTDDEDQSSVRGENKIDRGKRQEQRKKFTEDTKGQKHLYPSPGFWTKSAYLGGGGYGQAWLMLNVDKYNIIRDRAVAKDAFMTTHQYGKVATWFGDPRKADERTPMETEVMRRLTAGGSEFTVKLRHACAIDDGLHYRLYMDFCPHGSLHDLIITYDDRADLKFIPEPAIWAFFDALVSAALFMQKGPTGEDGTGADDWLEIVHRDVKPLNVFLDVPPKSFFLSYPKAVLGDFGEAFLTDDNDALNPHGYLRGGTPGYVAPEMEPLVSNRTTLPRTLARLSHLTNIWQIGATMARLMNGKRRITPLNFDEGEPEFDINLLSSDAESHYSRELRLLVNSMTHYQPHRRQRDLAYLLRQIRGYTTKGVVLDLARGTRSGCALAEELKLDYKQDDYRIGMAYVEKG